MTCPLDDNVAERIFEIYVGLDGKIAREHFDTLLAVFFELTRAACTGREKVAYPTEIEAAWRNVSPRIVAFELWERFMVNVEHTRDDATRIFQAVNAYAPYSSAVSVDRAWIRATGLPATTKQRPGAVPVQNGLDPTVVSPGAIWDQLMGSRASMSSSKRP